ncbi:CRISPR-associated helicase Cas3' [Mucilaginibacter paludis]|uniref:CRISPR-associated helicase Cas3 n=1 Tax=Mucilaginibacter paludis DSM 18603 TaxID=714943 RepID=H1YB54_9SPHI|nr:CRISPR-associated helicase Cas3' [Mucilaginibacter paludis]EHQ30580.1 CRISPR-associated helicase Cas3 [Mucilaginibacter paludis DSM 18603]
MITISNSIETFAGLKKAYYKADGIKNAAIYWAHTHSEKKPEPFNDHNELVLHYFTQLAQDHHLEQVIDKLIFDSLPAGATNPELGTFIKLLFFNVPVYHDYGKVNENFQLERMRNKNPLFKKKPNLIDSQHSILSAYIYIVHHLKLASSLMLNGDEKMFVYGLIFGFSYPIIKHHASRLSDVKPDVDFKEELQIHLKFYLELFDFEDCGEFYKHPAFRNTEGKSQKDRCFDGLFDLPDRKGFPLFALLKLNFSLLTAADYLATHEYMSDSKTIDFGVFCNRSRINEIVSSLRSYKHNRNTFDTEKAYHFKEADLQDCSNENLNLLRQEMAVELIHTIRKNSDKRLFYIEAPTGGGKTNLSMIAVTELLEANPEINKVFYVFPFTTLITQTYQVLKETLGLTTNELTELHSKANPKSKEEKSDGEFGDEKKDYIDRLFALFPVTVLSHVKFFDILKSNNKEVNYLLHRMANSVVIIDELQSYSPDIWDKMLFFISQYAQYFNVRFVLMSATLPKIGDLQLITEKNEFVSLLPNAIKYIRNPNFSKRVNFRFDLFEGEIELDTLADAVITKSEAYAASNLRHKSVHTIVEFIFKKTATEFHQLISEQSNPYVQILVLSGTILESRRKEVINFLKNPANRNKNILLITTQVVEAGVDIDMDLGFKNISLIDSDEQLAGRVNRNGNKLNCEVYLFKVNEAKLLYGKDKRYQVTREKIDLALYERILKEKDFRFLYNEVFAQINQDNALNYADNFSGFSDYVDKLNYEKVNREFKIIDQNNVSVFIPLALPLTIAAAGEGRLERIFEAADLDFLERFGGYNHGDEEVDGQRVWEVYKLLINNKPQGFDLKAQIDFKSLQRILSKFTFSLIQASKDVTNIKDGFGREEYGYVYFSHCDEHRSEGRLYDYHTGLNSKAFNDSYFI